MPTFRRIPHYLGLIAERLRFDRSFRAEFERFSELTSGRDDRFPLSWENRYPCPGDKTPTTSFDRHYTYHPAWAARILAATLPAEHVDISSKLYFATMVSAFLPVRFYDLRPANVTLSNLVSGSENLLALSFPDNSIASLSCMHTIEHIGLGRYGDEMDPIGDLKAIAELQRVLEPGGSLLFVVPTGKPMLAFHAHRVYSYAQIMSYFPGYELRDFSLLPDEGQGDCLISGATEALADEQILGCGCYWFIKPAADMSPN